MPIKLDPRLKRPVVEFIFFLLFLIGIGIIKNQLQETPKVVNNAKPKETKQTRLQYYENKFLESLSPVSNTNSKSLSLIKLEQEQKERDKEKYCWKLVNNATHWGSNYGGPDFRRGVYKDSRGIITGVNCYGRYGPWEIYGKPGRSIERCNRRLAITLESRKERDLVYEEGPGSKIIEYSRFSYCNQVDNWSNVEKRIIGFGKHKGECLRDRKCYK